MDIEALRHSASHIMAEAVKKLYPKAKLGIGPAIKDGFYYDFDNPTTFTPEDLSKIESEMKKIIKQNSPFIRQEVSKEEAIAMFKKLGEDYKVKLLDEIKDPKVSIYKSGDFVDLCKGPHVKSTGELKHFKLLSIAGAYWHGIETNPMLERIYGTAFLSKEELNKFLIMREELKKCDHRRLGKDLDLFSFHEKVGAGLVLYHPNGALLRSIIEDYIKKEHLKRGYKFVRGPHVLKSDIWVQSGHYDYYRKNMYFFKIEGSEFAVKPMNCPAHILVYKSKKRSYKELPLRFFELGDVYRHEKSGVLHGLLRVRGFTQDDAHIFCLRDQAEAETVKVIDFVIETLKVFGFNDFSVELSTKPKDHIGNDKDWEEATNSLKKALEIKGLKYEINEGEGAFYGPKIDIKLKDVFGREWQCATIQCDFALPERFDLAYTDKDGKNKRPIMLHRVILGSIERFLGALIEHYGGAFPLWLCPTQVMIIPITDKQNDYTDGIYKKLVENDIRVEIDLRAEKMQRKIRDAQMQKIPYMLIVGEKEEKAKKVAVRSREKGDEGVQEIDVFLKDLQKEIKQKKGGGLVRIF
ncbi:MAG: threonine--tRNA ligase [Candidatus Omnitrophica bacterium]|nr:threonine--tRNA ligase [Candidatus Omnitrophota bacterium]